MIGSLAARRNPEESIPASFIHVLVVDDEPGILSLLKKFLVFLGYAVTTATNGLAALEAIQHRKPDLIISDILMPGMNGIDFCQKLRQDHQTALIPILIVSARTQLEDRLDGFEAGADDYLMKPFDMLELKARIEAMLARSRRDLWCNPLSRLPSGPGIEAEANRRINLALGFEFAYLDIDGFKAYNDSYGYDAGDRVLKALSSLLVDLTQAHDARDGFVGHVGGDDFILMTRCHVMDQLLSESFQIFDSTVAQHYSLQDRAHGGILSRNRQGGRQFYPFMRLSAGVVSTATRTIDHYPYLAEIASEVKQRAKRRQATESSGSVWDSRSGEKN